MATTVQEYVAERGINSLMHFTLVANLDSIMARGLVLRDTLVAAGYANELHKHPHLAEQVLTYRAFSDIAFNPEHSINCQAYAATLNVALHNRGLLTRDVLKDRNTYLDPIRTGAVSNAHENTLMQSRL